MKLSLRFSILILYSALTCMSPGVIHSATTAADTSTKPFDPLDVIEAKQDQGSLSALKRRIQAGLRRGTDFLGIVSRSEKRGVKAYEKGDFQQAAQAFEEAKFTQGSKPRLNYHSGNARYKSKQYTEALEAYNQALPGADPVLTAKIRYNIGNCHFRIAEHQIQSGNQAGIESYRSALAQYKKALEIDGKDTNAEKNIEVVQARIKELLERKEQQNQQQQSNPQKPPEPSAEAKKALARAMQLCLQRRYSEAKQVLEDIMQKDASATSFQAHSKRIADVLDILDGKKPQAPSPGADPRNQQNGLGVI